MAASQTGVLEKTDQSTSSAGANASASATANGLRGALPAAQDYTLGQLQQNEALRARQLCKTLSQLGPSFVKIGQALSSRPDLLPQVYLEVHFSFVLPRMLMSLQERSCS